MRQREKASPLLKKSQSFFFPDKSHKYEVKVVQESNRSSIKQSPMKTSLDSLKI